MGSQGVRAFTLGLRVPEGLTFETASFGGTALEAALLGGEPFYSLTAPTEQGIFATVILSENGSLEIRAGLDQPILNLTFHVDAIPTAPLRLLGAQSETPTTLTTSLGTISPTRRALALAGPTDSPAQGAASEGAPAVSEADLQWSMFEVTSAGPESIIEGGGVAALGSGEGAPALSSVCDYETLLGDPNLTPPVNAVNAFAFPGGQTIQQAIDAGTSSPGDWVVQVGVGPSGTAAYNENVTINLADFQGRTLYLYTAGADVVSLEGGPAIRVQSTGPGSGPGEGNLVVGWSNTTNLSPTAPVTHPDWYGFQIIDSGNQVSNLPAILIQDVNYGSVKFIGNWINDNQGSGTGPNPNGGGMRIESSENVELVFNEFSANVARNFGAAISSSDSRVFFANNWIHDNTFLQSASASAQRFGGGLYLNHGHYTLCRNFIYNNNAIQGGGVYARFGDSPFTSLPNETQLHLESNEIRSNFAYLPSSAIAIQSPYSGAGIFLEGDSSVLGSTHERELRVLNNLVSGNDIRVDLAFNPGPPPSETGGGIYINMEYNADANGEFRPLIEGNRIQSNLARLRGGGLDCGLLYLQQAPLLVPVVNNNTIAANSLEPRPLSLPAGSGLFLHTAGGLANVTSLPARNSIIWDNFAQTLPGVPEWFAECGTGVTNQNTWAHSILANYSTTCDDDLFGSNSVDADPLLQGGSPYNSRLTAASVIAIDSGDPSVTPFVSNDIDGDPWFTSTGIERGADEYVQREFVRGDATGDGLVDMADAVALLNSLFPPSIPIPNCMRAGDANDDEWIVIADPIFILNFLFSSGPPPPAPFPGCGIDPTTSPTSPIDPNENCIGCP